MSTKTTSRERTWTPRYAWMPVSTRHIKNGAHRSAKRSPTTLPERLGEQRHVELDGRDVVVRTLDPADRRREDVRLRPRFFRDALGQLEVVPGLHEDHLNAFGLHLANDLDEVLWRRRDAGAIFERADLDEAEARQEVDHVGMIGDHLCATHGLQDLVPALHLPVELLQERLPVLLERRAVVGREA